MEFDERLYDPIVSDKHLKNNRDKNADRHIRSHYSIILQRGL